MLGNSETWRNLYFVNLLTLKSFRNIFSQFLIFLLISIFHISGLAQDQVSPREQIFGEVDKLIEEAQLLQASLYSPKNFSKAVEKYKEAERRFQRGSNLNDIRKRLVEVADYLNKSIETSKLALVAFIDINAAKKAAMKADADVLLSEDWQKGIKLLKEAAEKLESGNSTDARKKSGLGELHFRTAELTAIKNKFLLPTWDLLNRTRELKVEDHAPKTLEKAKRLAARVEVLLNQNRYDTDEALQLAQEAKYEAVHAIYLSQLIKGLKKSKDYEGVLLESEAPLQKISSELQLNLEFTEGLQVPTNKIITAIKVLASKIRKDESTIDQKNQEIKNLEEQVETMKDRLGSATETEKELQSKLAKIRDEEEKMKRISKMFATSEANVLRSGSNIIIRLYGLTFPVGKAIIEPQYFQLLSRVKKAFDEFTNAQIIIEGHTDSRGSDELNLKLSQDRAQAVARYFTAIEENLLGKIQSEGYGESRPIASNNSEEGRAINRRIDIVITPVK